MMDAARTTLKLAVGQMCSANTHAANIETVEGFAVDAAAQGADLLALPEVAGLMNRDFAEAKTQVVDTTDDPFLQACARLAKQHGLWLHAGSTPVKGPDGRFLNRSVVFDADGQAAAQYDKVHLFDVTLEGRAPIGESKRFAPGGRAVILPTPWGKWGLTICYDLRFPHMFRAYGQAEVGVIFVPSAFTVQTGKAHWEVLLRARAIETGAFVIATAQAGTHADGRTTYGHSLVIDPWGEVMLDMGEAAPQLELVELDLTRVGKARAQIPAWGRDTPFTFDG